MLQNTIVQIMSYLDGLAQAGMIPMVPTTFQIGEGEHTLTTYILVHAASMFQISGVPVIPPVREVHFIIVIRQRLSLLYLLMSKR